MPIMRHLGPRKELDYEECYRLWTELGTLEKVSQHLASNGKLSKRTGRPFAPGAIRHAAYRWMQEHPGETYKELREAGGFIWSEEEWEKYLIRQMMKSGIGFQGFHDWIERHNFQKYEDIYKDYFSTKPRRVGRGSYTPLVER